MRRKTSGETSWVESRRREERRVKWRRGRRE